MKRIILWVLILCLPLMLDGGSVSKLPHDDWVLIHSEDGVDVYYERGFEPEEIIPTWRLNEIFD